MKFFAMIGARVLLVPVGFVLALALLMWRAWWMLPIWDILLVPLGLPSINYWRFAALLSLIGVLRTNYEVPKKTPETMKSGSVEYVGWVFSVALGPPITYYWLIWLLS